MIKLEIINSNEIMRRLYLLLFVILFCSLSGLSQPRVDGQQKFKVLKSSPLVTNIVGWAYDKHKDKWAGYYNTIWDVYKGNNKVPIKTTAHNMSFNENIVSLQMKKIEYKNTIYYALIKIIWTGGYSYPSICEDWYKLQERVISVYDSTEYKKFFNLGESKIKVKQYCGTIPHSAREWTINNQLRQLFDGNELKRDTYGSETYFKMEGDNIIRFSSSEDMSDKYFEMKKSVFHTLIIK